MARYFHNRITKTVLASIFTVYSATGLADVTLYGRIAAAVEHDSFPSSTVVQPGTTSIQDYGSYFGIRGTDQIYGQTAAVWQIEQFLDITSGQAYQGTSGSNWAPQSPYNFAYVQGNSTTARNVLASSDSYIGLQGDWGRVRIGNISNTFRTNTGGIDIYNGANANAFNNYDRVLRVMPEMVRYDSPEWRDVSFSVGYSFNQDGNLNTGGVNGNSINGAGSLNAFNNAPILNWGIFYTPGNFNLTWNTQTWHNVGSYQTIGGSSPGYIGNNPNNSITLPMAYNPYVSRIEFSYNDPDGLFAGVGMQISQGLWWNSQPGFAGVGNVWIGNGAVKDINSNYYNCPAGTSYCSLNQNVLATQEFGASIGWHIENWTAKAGYVYGNNAMVAGSVWDAISGNNQIGGTGYQQFVVELDCNINPRTIVFINYGQIWYGNVANNTIFTTSVPSDNALSTWGPKYINNNTAAIGLSHTF